MNSSAPPPGAVTQLLARAANGDNGAVTSLFDLLYRELRGLAVSAMRSERGDHTLQPTALVHEAFLRLADDTGAIENRRHFFGVAASAMRRILVEHARARHAAKRGGHAPRVSIDDVAVAAPAALDLVDLESLDAALTELARHDPRQARVVELRYFAGLTVEEAADVLGASPRTVKRDWQMARAWLRREMSRAAGQSAG
ncbi:MAG: sigma-70 family RNA polymerase sigma factor [Acidobacteria bacterium]|nr:sigma-70 family RNA polymerase sigma factor [Acidobacteriota bacterium]